MAPATVSAAPAVLARQALRYPDAIATSPSPCSRAPARALLVLALAVASATGAACDPPPPTESASPPVAAAAVEGTPEGSPAAGSAHEWRIGALRAAEAEDARRYRREAIVAASRSSALPILGWPADSGLSGWFGERRGARSHVGLDIDGETGDPVVASAAGVVEWAGPAPDGYGGYGSMVLLRHGGGVQTLYAHLSSVLVAPEAVVEAGDLLGAMGTTGNVTGSHLHFEVRLHGVPVDPAAWLPAR